MPRRSREDQAGAWHHVVNRAIARRMMFERRSDFRFFCAQLARAVRQGDIEVHAFCLMGTHYHLLVRSPVGELGSAMRRIQLAYSRWFNRSRRRDGCLVRGRYFSKPVKSIAYRRLLVRYIDSNPVTARMVSHPEHYPYGSAMHYAKQSGPPWLNRNWIEEVVKAESKSSLYSPSAYQSILNTPPAPLDELVDAHLKHPAADNFLDNLVTSSRPSVHAWMVRKAKLADGSQPGLPVLTLASIRNEMEPFRQQTWKIGAGRTKRNAWPTALAGLGRDLCGASLAQLAIALEISPSAVSKLCQIHRQEIAKQSDYSLRIATITHSALRVWRSV